MFDQVTLFVLCVGVAIRSFASMSATSRVKMIAASHLSAPIDFLTECRMALIVCGI